MPKDGFVEVSVSDTGVGIAPEDQEAVFEEFRQVGTADKKVEGTGLGLTLCRKFVELHGGRIWVKSQVGVGSTFTFTIPVRRGDELILVVEDDDKTSCFVVRMGCRCKGYRTIEAGTGEEGVQLARDQHPALDLDGRPITRGAWRRSVTPTEQRSTTPSQSSHCGHGLGDGPRATEGHGRRFRRLPGQAD